MYHLHMGSIRDGCKQSCHITESDKELGSFIRSWSICSEFSMLATPCRWFRGSLFKGDDHLCPPAHLPYIFFHKSHAGCDVVTSLIRMKMSWSKFRWSTNIECPLAQVVGLYITIYSLMYIPIKRFKAFRSLFVIIFNFLLDCQVLLLYLSPQTDKSRRYRSSNCL